MAHIIAPSVLAADFSKLDREIEMINQSQAEWIHFDVMDGHFVPNISFGLPILSAVRKLTPKFLDVHLMMTNAENFISDFKNAGADGLTVHYECSVHLDRILHQIQEEGMKAGVALNPHTPVEVLKQVIEYVDLVLIMSVNPGFGGQKFQEQSLEKVKEAKAMIEQSGSNALIEVDGGVVPSNAAALLRAGADVLVSGSGVFKSEDSGSTINQMCSISPNTILS